MAYEICYYCMSHIGKVRKINQDNFVCIKKFMNYENEGTDNMIQGKVMSSQTHVFGVFDGMGGEEQGEMAAYIAAKRLSEFEFSKNSEQDLIRFCKCVNSEICQYTVDNLLTSMGTTAAILLFLNKKICLCNIGDSKIFYLSGAEFQQISHDHILVSTFGKKPPLTQNLGIPETELHISPYISIGNYHDGDIYLICSDGLSDFVPTEEIKKILRSSDEVLAAEKLLDTALNNGGRDNITFIILYIKKRKNKYMNFLAKKEVRNVKY